MHKLLSTFVVVALLAAGALYVFRTFEQKEAVPAVVDTTTHELITITKPSFGDEITSPLSVKGEARGMWFFEGSFPIELYDDNGTLIAEGFASVNEGDNWMTEEFVPFAGTLTFPSQNKGAQGTLVFKRDNPSGLPEYDDSFALPIVF